MNYFTYDNVNAATMYDTYIAKSNMFDAPEEEVETLAIPGSNRIVYLGKGTFKPFTIQAECFIKSGMTTNVDALRSWLKSVQKESKYIENDRPGEYRLARFIDAFELGTSDRVGAAFTLRFIARPERFLTSGDTAVSFTADGTIDNPTLYASKPLIRVYDTGTLDIGAYSVTVTDVDGYVDIDFDTMQAYKGTTNCNGDVTFGELVLEPGTNTVDLNGISHVDITPRWYTL